MLINRLLDGYRGEGTVIKLWCLVISEGLSKRVSQQAMQMIGRILQEVVPKRCLEGKEGDETSAETKEKMLSSANVRKFVFLVLS